MRVDIYVQMFFMNLSLYFLMTKILIIPKNP